MKNYFKLTLSCLMIVLTNSLSITSVHAQNCANSIATNERLEGLIKFDEKLDNAGLVVTGASVALLAFPPAELASAVLAVGGFVMEAVGRVEGAIFKSFKNNQYGAPKGTFLPWETINNNKPFLFKGSDGDIILITSQPGTGKLKFEQGKNMNYWKGIVIFEKKDTNNWREIMCLQDNKKVMTVGNISPELAKDYHVVLSKAKTLGAHTNMYLIENWDQASTQLDYTFNWVKD